MPFHINTRYELLFPFCSIKCLWKYSLHYHSVCKCVQKQSVLFQFLKNDIICIAVTVQYLYGQSRSISNYGILSGNNNHDLEKWKTTNVVVEYSDIGFHHPFLFKRLRVVCRISITYELIKKLLVLGIEKKKRFMVIIN